MKYYYAALNMDRYMLDNILGWTVKCGTDGQVLCYCESKDKAQQIVNALNQMELES